MTLTDILLELVNNNPWLLYVVLGILGVLVIYSVLKGREVSIGFLKFGKESHGQKEHQVPQQQQAQKVNVYTGMSSISPEQMGEVAIRITEKASEVKQQAGNKPPDALYQPSKLPERIEYIYTVQYEIEKRVRSLVLSEGGPWMGSSWARFSTYLDYAVGGKVIPQRIAADINDLYFFTQGNINSGRVSDSEFLEIQYLAAKIGMELNKIPLGPLGPEG